MNKYIWIVVALIIVIAGVFYFMNTKGTSDTATNAQPAASDTQQVPAVATTSDSSATPSTPGASAGNGTIASLMAMTGSVQCSVTVGGANPSSGTVYVSAGKMHGDFTATVQGKTMHAFMINDGTYVYSWSDMVPQGVKIKAAAAAAGGGATQAFSASTNVSYNCTPWTADPSAFTPPSTVKFMAIGGQ